jgi:hypothetical protein
MFTNNATAARASGSRAHTGSCVEATGKPELPVEAGGGLVFLGCVLRPILLAGLAAPGALDLAGESKHDQVIVDAAVVALRPVGAEEPRNGRLK